MLTKSVAHQFGEGTDTALSNWQIYTVVGLGACALVVSQSAYQAGPLALSMPAIAIVEPVVAVVIGDTLFDEQARLGGLALAFEASAALGALVGLWTLATSPTVLSIYEQGRRDERFPASVTLREPSSAAKVRPAPRPSKATGAHAYGRAGGKGEPREGDATGRVEPVNPRAVPADVRPAHRDHPGRRRTTRVELDREPDVARLPRHVVADPRPARRGSIMPVDAAVALLVQPVWPQRGASWRCGGHAPSRPLGPAGDPPHRLG